MEKSLTAPSFLVSLYKSQPSGRTLKYYQLILVMSIISDGSNAEPNWFSILPRETCDTPGPSTKQIFGIAEPTELRIPVFPPPASPSYDRCDSPAPLILTQDEAVQLEYLKVHGLPPPGEAKPVPKGKLSL